MSRPVLKPLYLSLSRGCAGRRVRQQQHALPQPSGRGPKRRRFALGQQPPSGHASTRRRAAAAVVVCVGRCAGRGCRRGFSRRRRLLGQARVRAARRLVRCFPPSGSLETLARATLRVAAYLRYISLAHPLSPSTGHFCTWSQMPELVFICCATFFTAFKLSFCVRAAATPGATWSRNTCCRPPPPPRSRSPWLRVHVLTRTL